MERRRLIPAKIVPGVSLTRFFLDLTNPMFPDSSTEIHVAHHDTGDLKEDAQWYNIYEHPDEHALALLREQLNINEDDWKILEHVLGSFRWAIYKHTDPSEIRVDVDAMKTGTWTTSYF